MEELSHGNQQRAQLAAALVHEPELLVLDEPFAGLDPVAVRTLAEVLRDEAARGVAVLFSSHQLDLVEDICEEVAIIDRGRIVAEGNLDALRRASERRRIALRLDGAPRGGSRSRGADVVERTNGDLRLLVDRDVDPQAVLAAAERTAPVIGFSYGPPSLAELFLELWSDEWRTRDNPRRHARDSRAASQQGFHRLDAPDPRAPGRLCRDRAALRPAAHVRLRGHRSRAPGLAVALQRAAEPFDEAKVKLHTVDSAQAGRRLLEDDKVDALLLVSNDRLVFRKNVDAQVAAAADAAVRAVRNKLPPEPELTTSTLHPPDDEPGDAAVLVAYAGSLLLFMSLAFYGQWVISGVVEEKNNRVVEVILSAVRPRDLLAGKVIGIGTLGLAQLVLVVGFAVGLLVTGVFDVPASLGADVALVVPWFVLGFALYAVAYAVAGALASNQQNAETAAQPVTYALLTVYFASYIVLAANAEGTLATVLTVFPLTAPLVLPARSALVGVPLWQHALAIVLVLAAIYALVRFAGRVYALGLLHGGSGLGLRAALRIAREN